MNEDQDSRPGCTQRASDRPGGRSRRARKHAFAVFAALIACVSLVGACNSNPDVAARDRQDHAVAAQDQIVQLWSRVEAAQAHVEQAKRTLSQRRQVVADAQRLLNRIPRIQQTLRRFGVTLRDLCAPNGGRNASRALAYLHLSCPSHARWKIDHPEALQGPDLVNQQTIVRRLNRVETAKRQLAAAQREVARRRRVATRGEALLNKNPRVQQVLKSHGFTFDNLCIPIAPASSIREGERRRALRDLRVTCPSQ